MRQLPLLALLLAAGCADAPAPDPAPADAPPAGFSVTDAVARPVPEGGTTALYLAVANGTDRADTLLAIRSAAAARVEIHRMVDRGDGMRGMEPVDRLPVPPGATVALAPGSRHGMLVGVTRALAVGDSLDVTLVFAARGARPLRVPVALDGGPTE